MTDIRNKYLDRSDLVFWDDFEENELTDINIDKFGEYDLLHYLNDIESNGLVKTWQDICNYIINFPLCKNNFLQIDNYASLYEIGLAEENKFYKKNQGQYYTPDDVAHLMAKWAVHYDGYNICDVACGTGNLIFAYLDSIGMERAKKTILDDKIYVYDSDFIALNICKTIFIVKYGKELAQHVQFVHCDFLDGTISLPQNAIVISNPPYARIKSIKSSWQQSFVVNNTLEMYSVFMEKIFYQAEAAVILTPFSFLSAKKFAILRNLMCEIGTGFVISFDNVPGNIFCGKKNGIFNSNTANSVRAAITVFNKSENVHGYKISPLIRFKNAEREKVLCVDVLERTLPDELQCITRGNKPFKKVHKDLLEVYELWVKKSKYVLKDFLTSNRSSYFIDFPNTCRYFTTASSHKLDRQGSIGLYINNMAAYKIAYCILNSSFCYWWWRIFDGSIIYKKCLLENMPFPMNLITKDDEVFFETIFNEMSTREEKYIVTKNNAGMMQENIKFPLQYRRMINQRMLKILGSQQSEEIFNEIHSNSFFEEYRN